MNKQELTERYYSQLNESAFTDLLKLIVPGLAPVAKVAIGTGAGLYGIDQILDFGKEIMNIGSARTPQKDYGTDRLKALTGQNTKQVQTGSTMSTVPKTAAEQKQDYIMSLQADKQLQGMPVSKRFTAIGKERAMAANINKAKMKEAKEAALQDSDYQSALKTYQSAKKNEKPSDRQASSLGAGYSESSKGVKDAHAAMVKAREKALSKSSEYKASSEAYANTTSGSLNLAKYDKNYSGFSVGRGVGGKPIITGGSYVNPNSAEGRIEASIAAGNESDLQRDPRTGRLDPSRSAGKLADDAKEAKQAAFDKSIGFPAAGMSQKEIEKKLIDRAKGDTSKVLGDLEKMNPAEFEKEIVANTLNSPESGKYTEILRKQWGAENKSISGVPDLLRNPEDKPISGVPKLLQKPEPEDTEPTDLVSTPKFNRLIKPKELSPEEKERLESEASKLNLKPGNSSRKGFYPASPDRPKPGFGSMGKPTPATKDELIAKAASDIRFRFGRSKKDPSYPRRQQKTITSDANIRGAGQEIIKNVGTLYSKYRTQLEM